MIKVYGNILLWEGWVKQDFIVIKDYDKIVLWEMWVQ